MPRAVLACALVMAVAASCTQPRSGVTPAPTPTTAAATLPAVPTASPATCPAVRAISPGAVTGRYAYPTGVPNDQAFPIALVNADDPSVHRVVHTKPGPAAAVGEFTIAAVEPGTYFAVGYLAPDRIVAYTAAAACGLGAECTDHSPIRVTVRSGQTLSRVDLIDWSVVRGSVPAQPAGSAALGRAANVRVCNPYADSVNVRASAGLGFPVRRTLDNGTVVVVRDGPLTADGYDWYEVNLANDQFASGWMVGYTLRR